MSKRVILYARVSTDMQRGNYSIPSQIAEMIKYSERKGYGIVGDQYINPVTGFDTIPNGNDSIPAYVDDYSSRELSRPKLDYAFQFLENVGYDILIVYSLDRLARDPYIRQTLEREIEARGAKVEYVLGNYEESIQGEIRKDLDATFAKWENAVRVERSNRGKIRKAKNGLFVKGSAPYGYKKDENAKAGLAIDEKEAEIVRWIFDMYANEGLSIRRIILALKKKNIISPTGLDYWSPTSLRRLLKNTVYIGCLYYNKTKLLPNNKRQKRKKSEMVPISTTPIVEEWVFDLAQKRFEENMKRVRRQPKRFYLLGGLIICGDCGRPYITQTYPAGKQRRVNDSQIYRHRMRSGHCTNRSILAKIIEPMVWDEVVHLLKDPQRIRQGYQEALDQQNSLLSRNQTHLKLLNNRLEKLDLRRTNLNSAYIDPDILMPKAEYLEQMEKINTEWNSISEEIEQRQSIGVSVPTIEELDSLEEYSNQICMRLDFLDPTPNEKREILNLLHITIKVSLSGEVKLEGWFGIDSAVSIEPSITMDGSP